MKKFLTRVLIVIPVAVCAFGAEGYVRLSFAASRDQLNGGLERLEQFLKSGA